MKKPTTLSQFRPPPSFSHRASPSPRPPIRRTWRFSASTPEIIELISGPARVAIAPAYQGRVMTSTAAASDGQGFGWINPEVIAAGIKPEAERRTSPNTSMFSAARNASGSVRKADLSRCFSRRRFHQTFANWKTPAVDRYRVVRNRRATHTRTSATFAKSVQLPNRAGTVFSDGHQTHHHPRAPEMTSRNSAAALCPKGQCRGLHHGEHGEEHR